FSSPAFAGSSWRWTTSPPSSHPSSSTSTSIMGRGNPRFADETLLTTPESLHAERDQYHAVARSRFCAAHHIHDHHAAAGKQYEPGDPIQWHEESAHQHVACANGLNRSHRRDPVQQSGDGPGNSDDAVGAVEKDESGY